MRIVFEVPGVPVAQPRQRHTRTGHNYTPVTHPVNGFKAAAVMAWRNAYGGGPPLDEALTVHLVFIMPRPKALMWKRKPMPRQPHLAKPDRDNLAKALQDALSGVAYRDDALVFDGRISKWIAAGDESPKTEVTIETIDVATGDH